VRKPVACQIVPIEVSVTGRVGGKLDRDHDSKVRYLPSLHQHSFSWLVKRNSPARTVVPRLPLARGKHGKVTPTMIGSTA